MAAAQVTPAGVGDAMKQKAELGLPSPDKLKSCMVCCCFHYSLYTEWPNCCSVNNKFEELCIKTEGGCGLVPCEFVIKANARQLCCVRTMAFPPTDDVPFGCGCFGVGMNPDVTYAPVKALKDDDVMLQGHCCCDHGGLSFTMPDCLGGAVHEKMCCFAGKSAFQCQGPNTCIKGVQQEFCIHSAMAFPPDDEVPLGCGCMGMMIFGKAAGGSA
jgi:hypothetical protein